MSQGRPQQSSAVEALLDAVEDVRPVIEECAAETEAERALADPVYDAMLDAGLFRTLAPKAFGGLELHPTDAYQVWEEVARIDSAAGWCLQISSAVSCFGRWLPKAGGEEIFERGPDTLFAGGFHPGGPSIRVEGGWRVTSRTSFASGCHRAAWFFVPVLEVPEDASRFDPKREDAPGIGAYVPRDEVDIIDNWNTSGMRGTFSAEVNVDDVFVPDDRIAFLEGRCEPAPAFAGPLYATVPWPAIHSEATVSLGIARAAIEKLVDLANRKTPGFSRIVLRDREMAQHHAGKASALVDASRATLHASISNAYREGERDGGLSDAAAMQCQLAACFTAEACAQAVDLVHEAAGTSGIRLEHGFERHHRDIHVLTQHGSKSPSRYEDVGKMMFGLPPNILFLRL